ncbi:hypothetical protein [Reichenbachiella ulvae]|uniref:Uncharacterized protein n=1 Tax=Reichenbachiella ulvae TaxID=2980104 RepID=A0ABT3CXI7_9BACT|nr:hypothetical protein [Reichenbachiella ulvae]MCV9388319.1 hypothetical protein [Reichenbachiella ulvae]
MNLLKPTIALLICMQAMMAHAQKEPVKFSKDIMRKDLEMTHYEKDSSASAVILCDYGRSWIDYGSEQFQVKHERITRIKILNKDGYKYADHSFTL